MHPFEFAFPWGFVCLNKHQFLTETSYLTAFQGYMVYFFTR